MNRKQRRNIEKQMGILKHRQSKSIKDRVKLMADGVVEKKQKQNEKERRQKQEKEDQEKSADVASMATTLMVTEGLSYIDALEKARELV